MRAADVYISEQIWRQIPDGMDVVDLRLRDGRIIKAIVVDNRRRIEGKYVGGQDGVREQPLDFTSDDIVAVRVAQGLLGCLGLTRWKK